jgi:signal transduction histidine kinase
VVRNDFGWVVLVDRGHGRDEDVDALRAVLFVALPIATLVIGVLIWLAVGRALRPVAEARAREERLLSDVGHELQSPIAGMRALMETEPSSPVGMRANRAVVLDELSRLEAVTEQLLELGHRRHASAAADTPVDLDEVVHREVARLAPQSGCHVDASAVRPGQVVGDEEALASMVDNLLRNAIRHASTSVVTSLAEHGDTVLLTIEDDGPGIGRADRSRVFDRFVRLDESRTRSDGGAGLGLAIVEEIVHAHRGSIDVEDGSLGGARFVVRLPASATLG